MRYTLDTQPNSKVGRFIGFTMTWTDEDQTIWRESWSTEQRQSYLAEFDSDFEAGIETATPSIYQMIQAVD